MGYYMEIWDPEKLLRGRHPGLVGAALKELALPGFEHHFEARL